MESKIRVKVIDDDKYNSYVYNANISEKRLEYVEEIDGQKIKTIIDLQEPTITKIGYINYQMPLKVNTYQRLKYSFDNFVVVYDYFTKNIIIENGYIRFDYDIIIDDLLSKKTIIINY